MKKFLALVLALVMTMSLVTISAGAEDFTDAADITYKEAVDVMTAVKVVDGYTDGSFNPTAGLTRGAAAKIICNLILGPTTASALVADAAPYSDVPTTNGFAGYIAFCKEQGIISGYADGTFRPANGLTGYAFMKMLLGALGYDASVEGYTGDNWSIAVAKRALNIGLDNGLKTAFTGVKQVTREEALLYAFNTMKADMVEYDTTITIGDVTIAGSKAAVIENKAKTEGIANDDVLQFAEKYFSKLAGKETRDAFGRPATEWKNGTKKIGTYVWDADLEYTEAVKLGDIYADLGLSKATATDEYAIDGKDTADITLRKGLADKIGGNGILVQVWYDVDADELIITQVETYVAKVGSVVKATASADRYVILTATSKTPGTLNTKFETEAFAAKDLVTYTAAYNTTTGKYDVQSVALLDNAFTGTLTEWNGYTYATIGQSENNFTVGGETYKYSANYIVVDENGAECEVAAFEVDEAELNVYVDDYGYAIYVDGVEAETNYAVVIGVGETNAYGSETKGATLMFADGTKKEVTAKMDNWATLTPVADPGNLVTEPTGDIVTYTVDDDGVYKLTIEDNYNAGALSGDTNAYFKNGKSLMKLAGTTYYTTSETVFVVATLSSGKLVYNVYTGYANMPSIDATTGIGGYAVVTDTDYTTQVDMVYLYATSLAGADGVDTFFVKPANADIITNSKGSYYVLDAIVDGEPATVMVDATISAVDNNAAEYGVFAITNVIVDKNGIITSFTDVTNTTTFSASSVVTNKTTGTVGTVAANKVVMGIGGSKTTATYWAYNDDTAVYYVDKDFKTITVSSVAAVATDANDYVYAEINTATKVLTDVIVVEQAETAAPEVVVPEVTVGYTGSINGSYILVDTALTGDAQTKAVVATLKAYGYELEENLTVGQISGIKAAKDGISYVFSVNPAFVTADYIEFGNSCSAHSEEYVVTYLTVSSVPAGMTLDDVTVVAYNAEHKAVGVGVYDAEAKGNLGGTVQCNFYACACSSSTWSEMNQVADIDDIAYVALYIDGVEYGTDSNPVAGGIAPVVTP